MVFSRSEKERGRESSGERAAGRARPRFSKVAFFVGLKSYSREKIFGRRIQTTLAILANKDIIKKWIFQNTNIQPSL